MKRSLLLSCGIVILGVLFLFSGCDLAYKPDVVKYSVTGTASSVSITLSNATGGTEQFTNVPLPWQKEYSSFTDWFLYVSAQNEGSSGTVTVTIHHNGTLVDSATSSGAYVIATASGSIDSNW